MFSGLVKFVDTLLESTPPANFRQYREQDSPDDGGLGNCSSNGPKRHRTDLSNTGQSQSRQNQSQRNKKPRSGGNNQTRNIEDVVTQAMKDAGLEDEL